MTKPDDIPQDVWDAAAECFAAGDWPLWLVDEERHAAHVSMARAIMAEREACADAVLATHTTGIDIGVLARAATAIRSRGEAITPASVDNPDVFRALERVK